MAVLGRGAFSHERGTPVTISSLAKMRVVHSAISCRGDYHSQKSELNPRLLKLTFLVNCTVRDKSLKLTVYLLSAITSAPETTV